MEQLKFKKNTLVLSGDKMFETVQGEGPSIGQPAVFMRLQYCNLRCVWCDTKYSWSHDVEMEEVTLDETVKRLNKFQVRRLVITGGEPLLQMKSIEKLIDRLKGWVFEVETNGTVMPSPKIIRNCQINMSPKLSNSKMDKKIRLNNEIYRSLSDKKNVFFKFVVDSAEDIKEVKELIDGTGIKSSQVVIMPQGIDSEEIRAKMLILVELVKKEGWRLLPRLQVYLWGRKRRV